MVKTGDWTIPDLIKYLVSVQSTLQPAEIERLRVTPAFPEEATSGQNRNEDVTPKKATKFKASDLYEPLDAFRNLGLPTIDWQMKGGRHKWRSNSEEGTPETVWLSYVLMLPPPAKFLFNLGLRRFPPTEVILDIAAKDEPRRTLALNYFLDNYTQKYTDYTPKAYANIAFVPAIHGGEKKLVKPPEVFSNFEWQSLGFPILDPALRQDAIDKLKIKQHPSTDQLVRLLETSPPTTETQAREWFGVLSRRISGLCRSSLMCPHTDLRQTSILPSCSNYPQCVLFPPPAIPKSPQVLDYCHRTNAISRAHPVNSSIRSYLSSSTLALQQTVS